MASDSMAINDQKVFLTDTQTKLYHLSEKDFALVVTDRTAAGTPQFFTTMGYQKIQLYPIPDATAVTNETSFEYEYYAKLATFLSGDSDASGLPAYAEPIVLDLAEVYAQQYADRVGEAQQAYARFLPAVRRLWEENSEILNLSVRDLSPALRIGDYEQLTKMDAS
jgi:hypothetical protein